MEEISYSDGIGFAKIKLKIDGVEAETLLMSDESDSTNSEANIQEIGENSET